jgi:hypothetical protein
VTALLRSRYFAKHDVASDKTSESPRYYYTPDMTAHSPARRELDIFAWHDTRVHWLHAAKDARLFLLLLLLLLLVLPDLYITATARKKYPQPIALDFLMKQYTETFHHYCFLDVHILSTAHGLSNCAANNRIN